MNDHDKKPTPTLSDATHDEALVLMAEQLAAWDLTMPPVEPIVSDCGLGTFFEIGVIEYWIANEVEAGYCGKFLFIFDGQTCPLHHHITKTETFFVVKGRMRMQCDGEVSEMGEGQTLRVNAGQQHTFTGMGPCLILEVSMPCHDTDNVFADDRIVFDSGN